MAFSPYRLLFLLSYQVAKFSVAETSENERIDTCVKYVFEEGIYLLYLNNPRFNSGCTLFIRAPQNFRILMDFRGKESNCERSSVKVIDGLRNLDSQKQFPYVLMVDNSYRRRGRDDVVHEKTKNEKFQEYDVCSAIDTNPRIETTFNVAQIVYKLNGKQPYVLVSVTFAPMKPDCNAVLYGEIEGHYVLTNHAKSGNCSWLVAGAVIITIDDEKLLQNDDVQHKFCSNQDSKLLIRSGSEGWSVSSMPLSKIICGKHKPMHNSSSFKDKIVARQTLANIEAKFRKKSNKVSNTDQQLMKRYEHEEENFLRNLEKLQKVRQQHQESRSAKLSKIPTSLMSQSVVLESSGSNKASDLLGSFCQIMQHVNRLRRENEHLKRQVVCFKEMRQMDRIRQEKEDENLAKILLCENCGIELKKKNNKSSSIKPATQNNSSQRQKILPTLAADKSSKKIGLDTTGHESNLSTKTTTTGNNAKFVVADFPTAVNDSSSSPIWYSCRKNNTKNKNLLLSTSGNDDASSCNSSSNILKNGVDGQQQTEDDGKFKSRIVTASKISISIESASERSSPSTTTTTTTATSRTPEDPSIDVHNSTTSSPALMSRSFSACNNSSKNNRQGSGSKNGSSGAGQFLTIPKRSIFHSYDLKSSNCRSIKFSAEEAMIEPCDMAQSQLLTNQTFATSADFSADSVFSLLETTNNNSISNNIISESLLVANGESSLPDHKVNQEEDDDDDDQVSIFAEVQLPDLKSKSRQKRLRTSLMMNNGDCSIVETESFRSLNNLNNGSKNKCLSYTSSLLERFGLRGNKHKAGITVALDNNSCASNASQLCQSFIYDSLANNASESQEKLLAKAIVRKRKRKISETDSIASSADGGEASLAATEECTKQYDTTTCGSRLEYQETLSQKEEELRNGNADCAEFLEAVEASSKDRDSFHYEAKASCMFFSGELPKIEFQDAERETCFQDAEPSFPAIVFNKPPNSSASSKAPSRSNSYLNASNDSVFIDDNEPPCTMTTQPETIPDCPTGLYRGPSTDLGYVRRVLGLQRKNSCLLKNLKEKTEECEQITDHLNSLEEELKNLKNKYKFDSYLSRMKKSDQLESTYVPSKVIDEMQEQMQKLDASIRQVKGDALRSQQLVMDSFVKEQSICRKYLDQIENLQKQNLQLMHRVCNDTPTTDQGFPPLSDRSTLHPLHEQDIGKYVSGTTKKVQQLRLRLLEKVCGNTQLNLELVQTQSSLLLANAQIQRQKVEIDLLHSERKSRLKRPESFHGQELLIRNVNDRISFFLPFKLQGERLSRSHIGSSQLDLHDILLYDNEQELAIESLKLMEKASGLPDLRSKVPVSPLVRNLRSSGNHDRPNSYSDYRHLRLREKPLNSFGSSNNSTISFNVNNLSYSNNNENSRPSSLVWNQHDNIYANGGHRRSFYESNMTFHNTPPIESQEEVSSKENSPKTSVGDKKMPPPIRLGNKGQVKSLAAVFNRQVSGSVASQSSCRSIYDKNSSKIPVKNSCGASLPDNFCKPQMRMTSSVVRNFQAFNFEKSSSPETNTVIQNVSRIPQCRKCYDNNFDYRNGLGQKYSRKQILANKQKSLSPPKQRPPSTPPPPPLAEADPDSQAKIRRQSKRPTDDESVKKRRSWFHLFNKHKK